MIGKTAQATMPSAIAAKITNKTILFAVQNASSRSRLRRSSLSCQVSESSSARRDGSIRSSAHQLGLAPPRRWCVLDDYSGRSSTNP